MTRMIERWFPCAEVSEASGAGWGSGNSESATCSPGSPHDPLPRQRPPCSLPAAVAG